ncbi:MAG TPA: hypothetical protein VKY27_03750 [Bacteriovoracaceae bacterium]|nr:hypothetical protein [Bacteriovoracaceae bacterium]
MSKFTVLVAFMLFSSPLWSQSLVDDANLYRGGDRSNVIQETIKIISGSKRIFIITNNNQVLSAGDFISIALDDKLAARAVVAKIHQGQVGVKILKIYSMAQWTRLRRDLEVQIVRGDDSQFEKKEAPAPEPQNRIRDEDDLYTGDIMIEDDLSVFDENKNRHIKPDNLVGLHGTYLDAAEIDSQGSTRRSIMVGLSWAYQFSDNYYIEGVYSRASFNDFPNEGQSTVVNSMVGRLKYNIKGPLYTFFQPYVGFRVQSVSSPDAGKNNNPQISLEEEVAIEDLEKSGVVFGVTVLRRLVPGWFVKANVGSDMINLGFTIEF